MNILAIIRLVRKIEKPPEVEQETAFRDWCGRTLVVLDQIATESGDPNVRETVETLSAIHSEDVLWDPAYDVLRQAHRYVMEPDQHDMIRLSSSASADHARLLLELVTVVGG